MQSKYIVTALIGAAFVFTGCSAADEAVSKTKDAASATAEKAGEMASDAKDGVKNAADKTGEVMGADIVVSNADAGFTYRHLMRNHKRKRWTDKKLDKTRLSMGLFVWYFGTKGTADKWTDVGHHTIVNGPAL